MHRRTNDLELVHALACRHPCYQGRIEIQHPPLANAASHGYAIMHLAGVDHDRIAGLSFNVPDAAPGAVRARKHEWRGKVRSEASVLASMPGIAKRCCSTRCTRGMFVSFMVGSV
jgi:hypothetical protein